MSIVIVGGHCRMRCQYEDICREFDCRAKVYTKQKSNLESQIGKPDLIVLFTNPVSHNMAKAARRRAELDNIRLVQSHNGSGSALRNILTANLSVEPFAITQA